jgi:hypothetical protein
VGVRARSRMRRLTMLGAAMALVATTGVATIAGSSGATSSTQLKAPKLVLPSSLKGSAPSTVNIGFAGSYAINFLPIEVAIGAGYFNTVAARFHTSFNYDLYGGGSTAEPAFLGGTDQLTVIALQSYLAGALAGKDQFSMFDMQGPQLGIVFSAAQKYKATRGSNIAAYGPPGNTWCQISPIGTSNTAALLLAATNHLNISQLNLTTIGSVAAVLPTLQSGQCQLTSGDVNSAANGIIQGTAYAVENTETPDFTIPLAGEALGTPLTTSHAFVQKYPKLAQGIADALLQGLLVVAANYNNANFLYTLLPATMQQQNALGSFAQSLSLMGDVWSAKFLNGTFPLQVMNDSVWLNFASNTIPSTATVPLNQVFSNTYAIQAYKDFGKTVPTGPMNRPAKLPSTQGQPSAQTAAAYATITGKPAPANTGPAPLTNSIPTTTTSGATTTSS